MIIGNNSNNGFNNMRKINYNNSTDKIKEQPYKPQNNKYSNPLNKNEMADKTYQMLEERLRNGLITLEEFHKKCNKLSKFRNKWKKILLIS